MQRAKGFWKVCELFTSVSAFLTVTFIVLAGFQGAGATR